MISAMGRPVPVITTHLRRAAAPACTVLLAVALAGCGSGSGGSDPESKPKGFADKSASEIVSAGVHDMQGVKSLRIRGAVMQDGKRVQVDLRSDTAHHCTGTMKMGGGTATFISAPDGNAFLRGDEAFWRGMAGADADDVLNMLGSKWAKVEGGKQFDSFCDLADFVKKLDTGDAEGSNESVGKTTRIGGQNAVEVIEKHGTETARMWVAVAAPHRILKFVSDDPKDPISFTLSDFDKKIKLPIPGKGEYVDLT